MRARARLSNGPIAARRSQKKVEHTQKEQDEDLGAIFWPGRRRRLFDVDDAVRGDDLRVTLTHWVAHG